MTQNNVTFIDFSKEDFWMFPESFTWKVIQDFKNDHFSHIRDPLKLKDSFAETTTIITLPIAIPGLKRFKKLKNIIVLGSGVPQSFYELGESVNIFRAKGINASSVAGHVLYFALKGVRESKPLRDTSKLSLGIVGSGDVAKNLKIKATELFREIKFLGRNDLCDYKISNTTCKNEFAKNSDIIVFCIDSNLETQKIIDKEFFTLTKKDAIYINVSRGDLFAEDLLIEDLVKNPNKQYFTDVTIPYDYPEAGPLKLLKNVYITNHVAGTFEGVWDELYLFVKKTMKEIK